MTESNPNQKLLPGAEPMVSGTSIQRWSAARKREVVLRLLRGESLEAVSREIGLEPYRLERWRERALAGLDASLKERQEGDPVQAGLEAAYKRVGELSMEVGSKSDRSRIEVGSKSDRSRIEVELLRDKIARLEGGGSFRRARSRR